jgi:hypothetical protein
MGILQSGVTADLATIDPVTKALRVSQRPLDGEHYRLHQQSGLLTTIAAATATAGHLWAMRWGSAAAACLVHRVRARWWTVTGFTAGQEIGMDLIRATSYSASHTGGTAATLTGLNGNKRTTHTTTDLTDMRIGTTAALTAGTHTLDTQAMGSAGAAELATGAAVPKMFFELDERFDVDMGGPLVLLQNEGLVLRNTILGGTAGVWRVSVEADWSEVVLSAGW